MLVYEIKRFYHINLAKKWLSLNKTNFNKVRLEINRCKLNIKFRTFLKKYKENDDIFSLADWIGLANDKTLEKLEDIIDYYIKKYNKKTN